jgi:hypothetical protein
MTITISERQTAPAAPAATVSFGYDAAEDRIVGVFAQGEEGAKVLLTRRLVRNLVASLAKLLDQSSPLAARAPAAMRSEVVEMEHRGAVAQLASAQGFPPQAAAVAARPSPAMLVARIDLTPQDGGHLLLLHDAGGRNVTVKMQWQDLHRLVGALHQQAAAAHWDLAAAPWLAPSSEPKRPAA